MRKPDASSLASFASLAFAALLTACAAPPADPELLSGATVDVVTAHAAGRGLGPRGIADRFTTEGSMVAFVAIKWPEGRMPSGRQTFESRWYSGDRLVVQRQTTFEIHRSPFDFWSNVLPINLGPGPARYEVYADGRLLASKAFVILPQAAPRPGPAPRVPAGMPT